MQGIILWGKKRSKLYEDNENLLKELLNKRSSLPLPHIKEDQEKSYASKQ